MSKLIYCIVLVSFYAVGQVAPFGLPENIPLKEETDSKLINQLLFNFKNSDKKFTNSWRFK